jgi:hypothetical protein
LLVSHEDPLLRTPSQQESIEELKIYQAALPTLLQPNFSLPFEPHSDKLETPVSLQKKIPFAFSSPLSLFSFWSNSPLFDDFDVFLSSLSLVVNLSIGKLSFSSCTLCLLFTKVPMPCELGGHTFF